MIWEELVLHVHYIPFALGLIANAKQRKLIAEMGFNLLNIVAKRKDRRGINSNRNSTLSVNSC